MTDEVSYKIKGNQTGGAIDIGGRKGVLPVDENGIFTVPAGISGEVHARIRGAGHKRIEVEAPIVESVPEPVPEHTEIKSLRDILTDVKGVGPSLASKILDTYSSVDEIAATTPEEMGEKIVGMNADLAETVIKAIKTHQARLNGA